MPAPVSHAVPGLIEGHGGARVADRMISGPASHGVTSDGWGLRAPATADHAQPEQATPEEKQRGGFRHGGRRVEICAKIRIRKIKSISCRVGTLREARDRSEISNGRISGQVRDVVIHRRVFADILGDVVGGARRELNRHDVRIIEGVPSFESPMVICTLASVVPIEL